MRLVLGFVLRVSFWGIWRGLLGAVHEVAPAAEEVGRGAAQLEERQVEVACQLGERLEEQPQLVHRVACGVGIKSAPDVRES